MIEITNSVSVDERDLHYTFQRSGGPGGQNINKVSTRVTLTFDVLASTALSAPQKAMVLRRLPGRINREGVLRVVSSRHRTQAANRRAARERFVELMAQALRPVRPRRKTRVPRAAKKRRLEDKRRQGEKKRQRRTGFDD